MLTIDDYIDQAKDNQKLKSDRQLGEKIGVKGSYISHFRTKRTWPSDETMIKIADLAGLDQQEALLNLNIWRTSNSVAAHVYAEIMDKFKSAAMLVIGIVVLGGIYFYDAAPASAEVAWYASDYILCKILIGLFATTTALQLPLSIKVLYKKLRT